MAVVFLTFAYSWTVLQAWAAGFLAAKRLLRNHRSCKNENVGIKVSFTFVGYRDIKDTLRFTIQDFTEDNDKVKKLISGLDAQGGADMPEDV